MYAVRHCPGAVPYLLRTSPQSVANCDNQGRTALHHAASASHGQVAEVVCTLLTANAAASATDYDHRTPLHEAAAVGNKAAVRVLISYGADPGATCNGRGLLPAHLAAAGRL